MVARTHLNVTLHVHCLSLLNYDYSRVAYEERHDSIFYALVRQFARQNTAHCMSHCLCLRSRTVTEETSTNEQ